MVTRYDLIVIGAGPAGLSAAIEAAKHGIKPFLMKMQNRADSFLSRSINFSDQKSIKQRFVVLRSVKNCWQRPRSME